MSALSRAYIGRARELRAIWVRAVGINERVNSELTSAAEQAAWDTLVDYIDAHGLTYTEHDPRGGPDE